MARDLVRLMQCLFTPVADTLRHAAWQPPVDVYRNRGGWLLKFDLAGVRPEDIDVRVAGNRLTVQGTRRDSCKEEGCSYYRLEISYSHFERTIELPEEPDPERIHTEYRDGMLLVYIPGSTHS
jgi:HSP20 family protein